MNLDSVKRIGISAAYHGGEVLRSYLGNLSEIRKKGAIDLVTDADIHAEKTVVQTLREHFPDHGILAEERGEEAGESDHLWIIDPLDGTTNFAHSIPIFSVSIAFAYQGEIVFGTVLNPLTQELFVAEKGKGAFLNGVPIAVSQTAQASEALLVTGFPYNFKEIFDTVIQRFGDCLRAAQGVRRLGAASLDLCFVACGRFDGFWEQNLKPWDTAAGFLIAEEAGARVSDFSGSRYGVEKNEILATNGKIHAQILSILQ